MAITSGLYTGVSGLSSNGTAMSIIGDNIANANTIGYKGSRATFGDVLTSSMGGSSGESQIGRGVMLTQVSQSFNQGSFETTSSPLDLAIDGNGFFAVKNTDNNATYYTRAGQFIVNKDGYLVNPEGYRVQGYLADSTGAISNNVGDLSVSSSYIPAKTTARGTIKANLNSTTTVNDPTLGTTFKIDTTNNTIRVGAGNATIASGTYTGAGLATAVQTALVAAGDAGATVTYSAATKKFTINNGGSVIDWTNSNTTAEQILGFNSTGTIAAASVATSNFASVGFDPINAPTTSDFSTAITAYDSLGNGHQVNVYFRKTAENVLITGGVTGNRWHWYADLASTDSNTGQTQVGAEGYLEFDTTGKFQYGIQEYNSFNFNGAVTQNQAIALDFGTSVSAGGTGLTGTTQYATPSVVISQDQDGYASGSIKNVGISQDGTMTGFYSNGLKRAVGQVALATVQNQNGLTKVGKNMYSATLDSGLVSVGKPGVGGYGKTLSNSLELSNVDLAQEFVKMMTFQRGFQANSKTFTTVDEMMSELINLKR